MPTPAAVTGPRTHTFAAPLIAISDPTDRTRATQWALVWIVGFLGLRLAAAGFAGLGVDESYTLAISRNLQLSYFDHPPLHQWIVHGLSGMLGYGRAARLPFVLMFAASSWLLFRFSSRLFGERAGLWAVVALNLSGFFSVVAGGWIVPDGPLIFCLLAAALQLSKIALEEPSSNGVETLKTWLLFGLWLGLAGLSKYQAIVFALGAAGWVLGTPQARAHLRHPGPYLAVVLAAVIILPVVVWNAQNGWASFEFQGGRAVPAHGVRFAAVLPALAGQALLLLPWVFVPLMFAVLQRVPTQEGSAGRTLCLALSVPGIVAFAITPIWGSAALPHWAMPSWLFAIPLVGNVLARTSLNRAWPKAWAACSLAGLLGIWGLMVSDSATGWIGRAWPGAFAKGDPTLEMVEWLALAPSLASVPEYHRPGLFIVGAKWMDAGKISQALGQGAEVIVGSDDPRGFAYGRDIGSLVGRDALIITTPRQPASKLSHCFARTTALAPIGVGRSGRDELMLSITLGERLAASCAWLGRRPAD